MWIAAILLFAAALFLSLLLTPVVRRLALRLGFLDRPEGRHAHQRAVPYGGGIAIFVSAVLPVAAAAAGVLYVHAFGPPSWLPDDTWREVRPYVGGVVKKFPQLLALLVGASAIFLLGLIDDRRKLGPWVKLIVQVLVAVALVLVGVRITAFLHSEVLGSILTVCWIVVITNAFNFMDNMDGLSAGVAFIVGCIFLVVSVQSGQLFIAAALLPFVGALAGFLPFNLSPARIFMGDAGALFLGFYLSSLSVLFTFYSGPTVSFRPFVLPLLIFAVPIYDAVSVTIIRLREGRSPFHGDRRHLSHRLVLLGLSERLAVGAIHLLTLGIGLSATLLYIMQSPTVEVLVLVQAGVLLCLVMVLERAIRS